MNGGEPMREELTTAAKITVILRLFSAGSTPQSARAIVNTRAFCEAHLTDRYQLDVVDIRRNPELAGASQIVATPTLIKMLPLPRCRFIGEMSRTENILRRMALAPVLPAAL